MTGSGFHRKCHMAYIPPVSRPATPKHGTPHNSHRDHSAERDEDHQELRPESSSVKFCYIKDSVQRKDRKPRVFEPEEKREKPGKTSEVVPKPDPDPPKCPALQRVIDCHVDNSLFNNPISINIETRKSAAPIKKINIHARESEKTPEEDPQEKVRMDWKNYHRLSVIHKFMDDLELDYPSLCTTGVIGTSVEGRKLKILKISNSNASNVSVWVDAGIHAREWIAPAVNTYIANHIARHFNTMPDSIRNKDWYFLPVINPDGYEYSHTVDRLWRKNRAWHGGQCVGVDLNRNFSLGWGGKGSSDQPNNAFYRGTRPFSEPESAAMRDLFLNSGLQFKVYITLHSYGQIIIFPYACSSELAPDYVRLLEGATAMSKAIYNTNGKTYKVGISRDVMYGAAGTSNDFSYGTVGIPYCYLIELRDKKHKFKLPKEDIEETGKEILNCVIALMEFIDNYKCTRFDNAAKTTTETQATTADATVEILDSVVDRSEFYAKKINSNVKHSSFYLNNSDCEIKWDDSNVRRYDCEEQEGDTYARKEYSEILKADSYAQKDEHYEPKKYYKDIFDGSAQKVKYFEEKDDQKSDSLSQKGVFLEQNSEPYVLKDSYCYITDEDFSEKKSTSFNKEIEGYTSEEADLTNSVKVAPPVPNTQVWEVKFTREGQRHFVKTLDSVGAINIWKEERSTMDIMVDGPRVAQVAGMLHEREIPFSIAIPDVTELLEKEQGSNLPIIRGKSSVIQKVIQIIRNSLSEIWTIIAGPTMDWKSYHRLDTIYAFMDNLAAEYPYLCAVSVIGKSVEGRDLKMLKISNGDENNSGVWLDGAIHPREWISPSVVTYIADRIVRTFNDLPTSVTSKDWYILPVMNPDGYEYTHTHDRMWRKNRARYGECVGVDLNRNFSYGFGEKGDEGSSDDPGNIFYRGPKAFSEPETAAVRRAITEAKTTFKVFLSFHSYGEVIIFPWGYTSEPCPDYVELLEGGTAIAKAIHGMTGHTYKVGSTKDLMYYAAGTSIDWSYAVGNIPYSYMIELRGKTHRFLLPKEEIITTAAEVLSGVYRLMDFVDRRCKGTETCACPK